MAEKPNMYQKLYEIGQILKMESCAHGEIASAAKNKLQELLSLQEQNTFRIIQYQNQVGQLEARLKQIEYELNEVKQSMKKLAEETAHLQDVIMRSHSRLKGVQEEIDDCLHELVRAP